MRMQLLAHLPTTIKPKLCYIAIATPSHNMLALSQDDASGRQRFQINPVPGGYNIVLPNGRQGCPGNFVTAAACTANADVYFAVQGAGPQLWSFTAASGDNSNSNANSNSNILAPLPSGYYQLGVLGRKGCVGTAYLGADSCSNGDASLLGAAGKKDFCV